MFKMLVSSFLTALAIAILYFIFDHSFEKGLIIFLGSIIILMIREIVIKKIKDKKSKPN